MRMLKYWGGIQVDYKCLFEFRNKTAVNIFNNISLYLEARPLIKFVILITCAVNGI